MTTQASCPDRATLENHLQGKLDAASTERLTRHIKECLACAGMIEKLKAADVTQALAEAQPASGEPRQKLPTLPFFLGKPQREGEIGRLAHYRVLKLIGEGGMGMVFQAEDTRLERIVALKVLKPSISSDPAFVQRFQREAKLTAGLKSDHVVTIYDVNKDGNVLYLAMELLRGESLETWLRKNQRLTVPQILRIGREVATALSAAHARGLLHRDIKPANLWLETPRGRVKVLDFGLARGEDDQQHITKSGVVVGTPSYMSPEQAGGEELDHRCDLFSLGCVLYHLCAGQQPFQGKTSQAVLTALLTREPEPLARLSPTLPAELSNLVMQLLSKKPADRPASAQAVIDAIRAVETGTPQAPGTAVVKQPKQQPAANPSHNSGQDTEVRAPVTLARRRWPLFAGAGVILAAVLVGVFLLLQNNKEPDRPIGPSTDDRGKKPPPVPPQTQFDDFLAQLKALNPGFKGSVDHRIEGNAIVGLTISDGAGVQDITPVAALRNLEHFSCRGNPVTDLAPLRGLKLTKLDVGWSQVNDLAPLRGMPLTELVCSQTRVADLAPLEGMPLRLLHCGGLGGVKSLAVLRNMPLEELRCDRTSVSDLTPLKDLPLTYLECPQLPPGTDLAPLGNLSRLTFLVCDIRTENDLAPLRGLRQLKTLNYKPVSATFKKGVEQLEAVRAQLKERNRNFDGQLTPVIEEGVVTELTIRTENITDISPLSALKGLRSLTCTGEYNTRNGRLTDLSPLKGLPLRYLDCAFNAGLTDLSPLTRMSLVDLRVSMTGVKDLTPVAGMKLENLGIYHTPVTDISPLRDMPIRGLNAFGCRIADITILRDMPLTDLYILFDPMRDEALKALLKSIKTLKNINAVDPAKLLN